MPFGFPCTEALVTGNRTVMLTTDGFTLAYIARRSSGSPSALLGLVWLRASLAGETSSIAPVSKILRTTTLNNQVTRFHLDITILLVFIRSVTIIILTYLRPLSSFFTRV